MINPSKYRVSQSWRIRLHALPALVVFFYRNLPSISQDGILKLMDVLLECLSDENVEVREMASKVFSGVVRCSQRQSIIPLKVTRSRFFRTARRIYSFRLGVEPLRCSGEEDVAAAAARPGLRGGAPRAALCDPGHLCAAREPAVLGRAVDPTAYGR